MSTRSTTLRRMPTTWPSSLDSAEWGRRYFSADDNALAGFVVLKAHGGIVEVGLGVRPDLTRRPA